MRCPGSKLIQAERVLNRLAVGVVIHDPDLGIVYANDAASVMLGVDPAELVRRNVRDVRWTVVDSMGRRLSHEQFPASLVLQSGEAVRGAVLGVVRSDDSTIWLVVDAVPQRDDTGRLEAILVTFGDITRELTARVRLEAVRESLDIRIQERDEALKHVMHALETAEAQSRAVLRSMSEGVVVHGPNGAILFANSAAERILGLTLAQMQGVHPVDPRWQLTDMSGRPFAPDKIPSEITRKTGQALQGQTLGVQRGANLGLAWLSINTSPIAGTDVLTRERTFSVVATFTDITERRKLEEAVRETQKREALGYLAAGVAHNFNNMLAVIVPSIEMAQQVGSPEVALYLGDAATAAKGATDLVRQLMQLVRKESSEGQSACDVNELLDDVTQLCRRTFGPAVSVHADTVGFPVHVMARRVDLQQVLVNLCINARDALAEKPTAHLDLRLRVEGERVVIEVEDNGPGMPDEVRKRVGEPFFTTKPQGKGTGLGLATAFATIEEFRGRLNFETAVGRGTRFRIELPRHPVEGEAPQEPSAEGKAGQVSLRALIIDDEPLVSSVLQRALKREGVEATVCQDGETGLTALVGAESSYDFVLLDLTMPLLDGAEVLKRIRAGYPDLPVYMMTGFLPQSVKLGMATGILSKPMNIDGLQAVLRDVVARRDKKETPAG
jgi:two-component system, cell cycle sensor histidine kinase and response regulator CckA